MKLTFKAIASYTCLSFAVLFSHTVAKADVMGQVENFTISAGSGLVAGYVISNDGKYIYSASINEISVQSRNPDTGRLTGIQTTVPFTDTGRKFGQDGLVLSPDGAQLYIAISGGILRYDVDSVGMLTESDFTAMPGVGPSTGSPLLISNDGRFMYAGGSGGVQIISRAANGNITRVGSSASNLSFGYTHKMEFGPNKETLYVSNAYTDNVYVFDVNTTDGSLTNTQIIPAGGYGTAISKDGKFFYSIKRSSATISIYNRDSDGKLSHFKDIDDIPAPASTPTQNILFGFDIDIAVSPNQKYIYTYAFIKSVVGVWKRNESTGDLTYQGRVDNVNTIYADGRLRASSDERHLYLDAGNGLRVFDLRSDLSLVKSGPSTDVAPNGTISYSLSVTNNGPSDAVDVVVTDTLPAGTSFISGTNNNTSDSCTASGQVVTCNMGQILENDGYSAVIQVKAPSTEGAITNTASVTSDQLDSETANNSDSATSTIKEGGSELSPVEDGGSDGGGSFSYGLLFLLLPALLRRRVLSVK